MALIGAFSPLFGIDSGMECDSLLTNEREEQPSGAFGEKFSLIL